MHKLAVKVNDVNKNYNFKGKFIYVAHITPLGAIVLLKLLLLCSLGIPHAEYMCNFE